MNVRQGMGFAALVTMVSVVLSRVLGLVREGLLASRLGTGLEADAYAVAFMLPDLLNTLLASGMLSITFLPLFLKASRQDDASAQRFLGGVQLLLGGLGVVGIGLLWIFAEPAMRAMQPSLAGTVTMERAVHLSRILLPAQIAFLLAGAWNGAQYARKRFLYPALAPLAYNGGILLGGWLLAPWMGAEGFAWGALAGALGGHLILQAVGAWRAGIRPRLPTAQEYPGLQAFVWRSLPLMLGLGLGFFAEFLLRRLSAGLGTGSVAEANYAFRLTMVLVAFFGQAAGVASYPYLVELATSGKTRELNDLLLGSLSRLAVFLLPACAIAMAVAPELVAFAFQRGQFSSHATQTVAMLFRIQALCVLPWCVQIVMARAFYARGHFWSTAALGTACVLACWPVWAFLVDSVGKTGASLGLVLLVGVEALAFLAFWRLRFPGEFALATLLRHTRLPLSLSLGCGLVAFSFHFLPLPSFARLVLGASAGGLLYLVAGLRLGMEELVPVRQRLLRLTSRFSRS